MTNDDLTRAELREELNGLADRMADLFASVGERMDQRFMDIAARFETQASRLDRHAALWQTGSRWSSRMDVWAEKIDATADAARKEIAALRERIAELERRLPPKA